jgi:hypothetical protein
VTCARTLSPNHDSRARRAVRNRLEVRGQNAMPPGSSFHSWIAVCLILFFDSSFRRVRALSVRCIERDYVYYRIAEPSIMTLQILRKPRQHPQSKNRRSGRRNYRSPRYQLTRTACYRSCLSSKQVDLASDSADARWPGRSYEMSHSDCSSPQREDQKAVLHL